MEASEDKHSYLAWTVFPPAFTVLGVLFHVFLYAVLVMRKMKKENLYTFFLFISVMDCTALGTSFLHIWLREGLRMNIRTLSVAGCRFHRWLSGLVLDIPPWILVVMIYEKRAFLWYPVPADSQFSRFTVKMVLLGLLLLFALRNLDAFSYTIVTTSGSDHTKAGNGNVTTLECDLPNTASAVFLRLFCPWLDFFLRVVSPFTCIVVYIAFIVRKIRRENVCAEKLMEKVGIEAPFWFYVGLMEARRTARCTAAMALIIFLCGLPYSSFFIYKSMELEDMTHEHSWRLLVTLLYFLNYGGLYALFVIQDHRLLITLRDTWRGPLVNKRGTNIASSAPRFVSEIGQGFWVRRLLRWIFRTCPEGLPLSLPRYSPNLPVATINTRCNPNTSSFPAPRKDSRIALPVLSKLKKDKSPKVQDKPSPQAPNAPARKAFVVPTF